MDDERIEQLRKGLDAGLFVWWMSNAGVGEIVYRIGKSPDEPGPVGYLKRTGHGADYIALYAVNDEDVIMTTGDLLK